MAAHKLSLEEINNRCLPYRSKCIQYNGYRKPSTMECLDCGYTWSKVRATRFPWCPKCHPDKLGSGGHSKLSNKEFQQRFVDRTITPLENYVTAHTKIKFRCDVCKYEWLTVPYSVTGGKGCIKCANKEKSKKISGKYYNKPTILYVVYFPKYKVYKIGITTRTVKERLQGYRFIVIKQQKFPNGKQAWLREQYLLKLTEKFSFSGNRFLEGGHWELRSKIPNLFKNNYKTGL